MHDVAVVGLGVYGASILHECAMRGLTAVGFDMFPPAHSFGSSHGGSRIFRFTALESVSYLDIAAQAAHLWERLDTETGGNLLCRTGFAIIAANGAEQFVHHG